MATKLSTPLHREADITSQWFRTGRVIITLHPGGFIGFREVGKRSQWKIPTNEAARIAVNLSVNKIRSREKELRAAGQSKGARKKATREVLQNLVK